MLTTMVEGGISLVLGPSTRNRKPQVSGGINMRSPRKCRAKKNLFFFKVRSASKVKPSELEAYQTGFH